MTKVLLIDPALAVAVDRFRQILPASVEIAVTTSFDHDELARLAADAEILVNARRRIDVAMLAMAPRVRFIQLIGIGYDTVDVAAVASAGITVAYNPGVNAVGVAEQTLMLMPALVKRLPWSERSSRAGQFATAELIGAGIDDLASATVGLIGLGDIGTAVAERLIPFGARIVYSTRRRRP
jgi:D-3-phosphoglycerate dehydrogenase